MDCHRAVRDMRGLIPEKDISDAFEYIGNVTSECNAILSIRHAEHPPLGKK